MDNKIKIISIVAISLLILTGCIGGSMNNQQADITILKTINQKEWNELSEKRIFFGHQSVGSNIIDGINNIMRKISSCKLNIQETNIPEDFSRPIFAHASIGKNQYPFLKIDEFKTIIDSGVGKKVDFAFFKFCYGDIKADTNINELFKYYADVILYLQLRYPKVKFLHFTVPLITTPSGFKTKIKRLIGYSVWTDSGNIKRNIFNRLLREKYGINVFDLAGYESTLPNGKRVYFEKDKSKFFTLALEYAEDEGHLNNRGKLLIGKELLIYLIKSKN